MKTISKLLLAEFIDFVYHYDELTFWEAIEKFKERKLSPPEETPLPEITEEVE